MEEKIAEIDKPNLYKKLETSLALYMRAINIVQKYIENSRDNEEYTLKIEGLKNGLSVLQKHYDRMKEGGIADLLRCIRTPKGKRGGLGLSRGFGDFLWEGGNWQEEIMNSIKAIECYRHDI